MLLQTPDQTTLSPPLVIEAAGQRYKQTAQLLYLGGIVHEIADLSLEIDRRIRLVRIRLIIDRRIRLMRACLKRFGPELYNRTTTPLSLKVRTLKAEVIETLMYGCVTWTLKAKHFAKLRTAHQVLLRVNWLPDTDFLPTIPLSRTRRPSR